VPINLCVASLYRLDYVESNAVVGCRDPKIIGQEGVVASFQHNWSKWRKSVRPTVRDLNRKPPEYRLNLCRNWCLKLVVSTVSIFI